MTFAFLPALLAEIAPLASRFGVAGFRLYLVGGIVRDQLLDVPLEAGTDIDLTTNARPPEVKRVIAGWADAVWDQGERFGTIGFLAEGRRYEVTTHRSEYYHPDSRKPAVAFGEDVQTDLSRRDFTINAMAVEVPSGDLVDPYAGAADLAERVLRTPLGATVSFTDDPLRMLRAARFVSAYDLVPTPDVVDAMATLADRLEIVAVERRRDELDKLITLEDPGAGLRLLVETGVADRVLPSTVSPEVLGPRLAALPMRLGVRMAAMLADDPGTASAVLAEMRYSNDQRQEITTILSGATSLASVEETSAPSLRRFVLGCGDWLDDSLELASELHPEKAEAVIAALAELSITEDLGAIGPALGGEEVMTLLGLEQGPDVGLALDHLLELRIEEGPVTAEAASVALRAWWDGQERKSSTS